MDWSRLNPKEREACDGLLELMRTCPAEAVEAALTIDKVHLTAHDQGESNSCNLAVGPARLPRPELSEEFIQTIEGRLNSGGWGYRERYMHREWEHWQQAEVWPVGEIEIAEQGPDNFFDDVIEDLAVPRYESAAEGLGLELQAAGAFGPAPEGMTESEWTNFCQQGVMERFGQYGPEPFQSKAFWGLAREVVSALVKGYEDSIVNLYVEIWETLVLIGIDRGYFKLSPGALNSDAPSKECSPDLDCYFWGVRQALAGQAETEGGQPEPQCFEPKPCELITDPERQIKPELSEEFISILEELIESDWGYIKRSLRKEWQLSQRRDYWPAHEVEKALKGPHDFFEDVLYLSAQKACEKSAHIGSDLIRMEGASGPFGFAPLNRANMTLDDWFEFCTKIMKEDYAWWGPEPFRSKGYWNLMKGALVALDQVHEDSAHGLDFDMRRLLVLIGLGLGYYTLSPEAMGANEPMPGNVWGEEQTVWVARQAVAKLAETSQREVKPLEAA